MKRNYKVLTWFIAAFAIISTTLFIGHHTDFDHEAYLSNDLYGFKQFTHDDQDQHQSFTHENPEFWGIPDL